jgi:hypothetical protein
MNSNLSQVLERAGKAVEDQLPICCQEMLEKAAETVETENRPIQAACYTQKLLKLSLNHDSMEAALEKSKKLVRLYQVPILPKVTNNGLQIFVYKYWFTNIGLQILVYKYWFTNNGSQILVHKYWFTKFWFTYIGLQILVYKFWFTNIGLYTNFGLQILVYKYL